MQTTVWPRDVILFWIQHVVFLFFFFGEEFLFFNPKPERRCQQKNFRVFFTESLILSVISMTSFPGANDFLISSAVLKLLLQNISILNGFKPNFALSFDTRKQKQIHLSHQLNHTEAFWALFHFHLLLNVKTLTSNTSSPLTTVENATKSEMKSLSQEPLVGWRLHLQQCLLPTSRRKCLAPATS